MSREQLQTRLKKLVPGQFGDVLFRYGMPPEYQQPGSRAEQAIALVRYAEQQPGGLEKLQAVLEQVTSRDAGPTCHAALVTPTHGVFNVLTNLIYTLLATIFLIFFGVWGFAHWKTQECEQVSVWWGLVVYPKGNCQSVVSENKTNISFEKPEYPLDLNHIPPKFNPIVLRHDDSHSRGALSITVLFNSLGGEWFATLRIISDNGETINKPVLGGEIIEISTLTDKFFISVLSLDTVTQTVTVKIDHS